MSDPLLLALLSAAAFLAFWLTGGVAVRRLVVAMEGSSEFGHGTTSRMRRVRGYGTFVLWAILAAKAASFFADWAWTGDAAGATDRFMERLRVLAYILEALGED